MTLLSFASNPAGGRQRAALGRCSEIAGVVLTMAGLGGGLACKTEVRPQVAAGPSAAPTPAAMVPASTPPAAVPRVVPPPSITLVFERPAEGERLGVPAGSATLTKLPLRVLLTGNGFAQLEIQLDDHAIATLRSAPWEANVELVANGRHELQAIGRDVQGEEVARVIRSIEVDGLTSGGCLDQLAAQGVTFKPGPATKGIVDPVLLDPLIERVTFRVVGSRKLSPLLASCRLGLQLKSLAALAAAQGLDEIGHLGVYNYRPMRNPTCIARGNCKLSQHAFANAIDIHDVHALGKQVKYSTEVDWLINKQVPICPGNPSGEADRVLHVIACQMHAQRIFNIILTPNYNALHRNHFHVDLTPASLTIKGEDMGVDPANAELLDD